VASLPKRSELHDLAEDVNERFDPDAFGLWYATIENRSIRIVRSNQVVDLIGTALNHMLAVQHGANRVHELVGPNGVAMPDPGAEDAHSSISTEIADALRAAGSLLDVLGGLTVLLLGLPTHPSSATSRHLTALDPAPRDPTPEQHAAFNRFRERSKDALGGETEGWVEWTLETRNAMVHRGWGIAAFFPVPPSGPRRGLEVRTALPVHRLVRYFPHLRRYPDLTDTESVLAGAQAADLWLPEPAQETLSALASRLWDVAQAIASEFKAVLPSLSSFSWPAEAWRLRQRSQRARAADGFRGFVAGRDAPQMDFIVMHPDTAKRLLPAETLRREAQGGS